VTLRLRLYIAAAVLLAVLSVLGVLLLRAIETSEFQQIDQQLQSAVPAVGVFGHLPLGSPLRFRHPHSPVTDNGISEFYVATVSSGHRDVLVNPLGAHGQAPQTPSVLSTGPGRKVIVTTVGSLSGSGRWRAVLMRTHTPKVDLLVAVSLVQEDATVNRLRLAVLGAGLVIFGVLVAAGFWVGRLGLRPIAEVTEVADAISAGDRSRRVAEVGRGTEAAHLARAFNVMLDDQQAIEGRLRQFVADASHELRTPVSVIMGIAGLWRQGDLRSGEDRDDAMRRVGQSSAQMATLVEDLLLLARLDEGRPLERAPVDLVALVHDAVVDASATNPSREIRVDSHGPVVTEGDEVALRQVIVNLINNCLRHTPPGATIDVTVSERQGGVVLDVRDSGPGMDAESTARAFDRFWRAEASRTRAGSGLGLPIVAGIVAAHGGRVVLDSDPERGTDVQVFLPGVPHLPSAEV
jgi:two-component system, OmpR family, sensor kinase